MHKKTTKRRFLYKEAPEYNGTMTEPTFRSIDHIVLRVADAKHVFRLLTEHLGLPITWALEEAEFATFGWASVGNTNLEIWASSNNDDIPAEVELPLVHGFALEPEDLWHSLALLARRGVRCKPPRAYQTKNADGELLTNFTNSVVLDVSSDSCCIFFCEWGAEAPITPWQKGLTATQRRAQGLRGLQDCAGGLLGILGLSEVRMAVPDISTALQKWQALTASDRNPVPLTPDINLRLEEGEFQEIVELTFAVQNLEAARAALHCTGLSAVSTPRGLLISPEATGGLRLQIAQA